jgi:Domain of unknown function (DUF4440)
MIRRFVASAVPIFASVVVLAQGSLPTLALTKAREEFIVAGDKGDKVAFQRLLTDDATWVDRAGGYRDKKAQIRQLQPAPATRTADAHVYPGGAVVVGTRKSAEGIETRSLQVWVQQAGQWKLAALQTVQIGEKPPIPKAAPSAALPPNAGSATDVKAIEDAIAALSAGNRRGDVKNFAASVTEQFVTIGATGVGSKQDRIKQLSSGADQLPQATVEQSSTRLYGDLAVTNRLLKQSNGREVRQTIVHIRQGGKWLRAGIIATPVQK